MKFQTAVLLVLFFVLIQGYTVSGQSHNGGIITLSGDTIPCSIASTPKDVGLKRQRGLAYYYDYIVAVFNNDSVRIIYPGTINGFYAKWPGLPATQTNWYYSDSIDLTHDMLIKKFNMKSPVFLQRLVTGGHYHLWYFEQPDPGSPHDRVFVLEENSTGKRNYFYSTRQLKKLLGDWPEQSNKPEYEHWFKGKQRMVLDYNRYRAGK